MFVMFMLNSVQCMNNNNIVSYFAMSGHLQRLTVRDSITREVGDLIEPDVGDLIEPDVGDLIEPDVGDIPCVNCNNYGGSEKDPGRMVKRAIPLIM